ncbi:MAG: hypothetical protein JSR86_15280 [Proteobacteria bacterium]|nr:hypothetical protein [Pseudomonadota bacterium]
MDGEPVEEAARFSSFSEAQVACSALRAAGVDAVVLDADPIAGAWREPYGGGGYRIGAPRDQVVQARALLRQVEAAETPALDGPRLADAEAPDGWGLGRLILIAAVFLAVAVAAVLSRL